MVIVDTSVLYKWFSSEKEELLPAALKILKEHLNKKEIACAPDIVLYELANAWATKTKLSLNKVKGLLRDFEETGINIEPITLKLIYKAIEFSKQYNVSVYDASYVVLAKEKKCNFITADAKFVEKVNLPFIKHLSAVS